MLLLCGEGRELALSPLLVQMLCYWCQLQSKHPSHPSALWYLYHPRSPLPSILWKMPSLLWTVLDQGPPYLDFACHTLCHGQGTSAGPCGRPRPTVLPHRLNYQNERVQKAESPSSSGAELSGCYHENHSNKKSSSHGRCQLRRVKLCPPGPVTALLY